MFFGATFWAVVGTCPILGQILGCPAIGRPIWGRIWAAPNISSGHLPRFADWLSWRRDNSLPSTYPLHGPHMSLTSRTCGKNPNTKHKRQQLESDQSKSQHCKPQWCLQPVAEDWNSLPSDVASAKTVAQFEFKANLDQHWPSVKHHASTNITQ